MFSRYLLKQGTTWNDLQRPTTTKKRPETTHNKQETTWNHPQRVKQNLQWPAHSYNEQRKNSKRPIASRFSGYFTTWGKRFSSLTHFYSTLECSHKSIASRRIMVKTERQASITSRQASIIICTFYGT